MKTHKIPERRLLDLKEAAKYLGRKIDSLREMVYSGELPHIQVGTRSKIWIDLYDLDAWIEKNKKCHYTVKHS